MEPNLLDSMTLRAATVLVLLLLPGAVPLAAQRVPGIEGGLVVGSEEERYLRVLQVGGHAPAYPWTLRGFTAAEVEALLPRDRAHPWTGRLDSIRTDRVAFGWLAPEVVAIGNTGYAFGENDGARWAGRGLTTDLQAGFWLRWGRLHVRIAPQVFVAQNAAFTLAENGLPSEEGTFRDSRFPGVIDLPQRFGDGSYARAGLGSSSLVVELPGVSVGLSGAAQVWGPSQRYPLMLGNNAGGVPHLFVQTARPLDVGIGRLHARYMAARLGQSGWSPMPPSQGTRFASAVVLTFLPRGVEGLELGAHRFADLLWPEGGIGAHEILRPFGGGVSVSSGDNEPTEDQLAGIFLRWTIAGAGVELWAEFLRTDFGRDERNYLTNPDDLSGRVFGLQRVLELDGRILALRGEVVSAETHHSERDNRYRVRPRPKPLYRHSRARQGHTHLGQLLGSPAAYGGSGWTLGADLYDANGRWSVDLFRQLRGDWLAGTTDGGGVADVLYGVRLETVRFLDGWDLTASVAPSIDLNRNVIRGNDVFNLNVVLGARGLPW